MKIIDINGNERECKKAYPDPNYPGYIRVDYETAVRSHHEWYPIKDFIKNNPNTNLAQQTEEQAEDIVGVVSSSSNTTLKDRTQKWDIDAYKNYPVWISRGKGEGQTRTVISNTKSEITIDRPWDILPNKTSQYVITYNVHDPQPMGNTLPGAEPKVTKKSKTNNVYCPARLTKKRL